MNQPIKTPEPIFKIHQYPSGAMYLNLPSRLVPEFKLMVQRALNMWPDCSPELKELGDVITNGRILQDYFKQAAIDPPPRSIADQEYYERNYKT